MSDAEDRSWAEKRMDARREARGLPTTGGPTVSNRWVLAVVLAVAGVLMTLIGGFFIALGILAIVGAIYQVITAAVAQGVRDGRPD